MTDSVGTKTCLGLLLPFWIATLAAIALVIVSAAGKFQDYSYFDDDDEDSYEYWHHFNHSYLDTVLKDAYL